MNRRLLSIPALALLAALTGCAGIGEQLDAYQDRVESRSDCHTSTGEWVGAGRTCTVSYSVSSGGTTTTTTTTTTTPAAPPKGR